MSAYIFEYSVFSIIIASLSFIDNTILWIKKGEQNIVNDIVSAFELIWIIISLILLIFFQTDNYPIYVPIIFISYYIGIGTFFFSRNKEEILSDENVIVPEYIIQLGFIFSLFLFVANYSYLI